MEQAEDTHAIADFDQAIRLNPQDARAIVSRGYAYLYIPQPDYARAIASSDQLVRLDGNNAEYQKFRCWARTLANRELDVARGACDAALLIAPNDDGALDRRGMVDLKQQRWQDAWNDYDAAARADSTTASHFYGRGIAALRLGRTAEGQADLAHATQLSANVAQNYAGYGVKP